MSYLVTAAWLGLAAFFFGGVFATLIRSRPRVDGEAPLPPLSILLPVRGQSEFLVAHVRQLLSSKPPGSEVLIAVSSQDDAAYAAVNSAIPARDPDVRLLIGEEPRFRNPKLRNIAKAYAQARNDLIFFIDDSVAAEPELFRAVVSRLDETVGVVSAAPLAEGARGLAAEVEGAACNGYQFRMQSLLDWLGRPGGFGNALVVRKSDLESAGGLVELDRGPCEDNALIVLMRRNGQAIKLARIATRRQVGRRTWKELWQKQLRWRNCPKCHDLLAFLIEPWLGGVAFIALGTVAIGASFGVSWWTGTLVAAGLWYGAEGAMHAKGGWHFGKLTPFAWIVRDLLHPVLTFVACFTSTVEWRGTRIRMTRGRRARARSSTDWPGV